jgi:adenine-specific DNA-methyltransferase
LSTPPTRYYSTTIELATRISQPQGPQKTQAPTAQKRILAKRDHGIYYTPSTAAQILAEWAIRSPDDSILEPSFGGCALLKAAVHRLTEVGCKNIASGLYGYDLDPRAFQHLDEVVTDKNILNFKRQNFLNSRPQSAIVSTILANPPFVSYRRMNSAQRTTVGSWKLKYGWPFSKEAGLWAYFLIHSLNFLKPGGRIAFILPSSITQADYATPLRDYITTRFQRVFLVDVNEQLFLQEGAVERTTILLAENYMCASKNCAQFRSVSKLDELVEILKKSDTASKEAPADTISRFVKSKKDLIDLGKIVTAGIGEVVGDVKFLIGQKEKWKNNEISLSDTKPIVHGASSLSGIKLTAEDAVKLPRLLHPRSSSPSGPLATYLNTYDIIAREKNSTFRKRKLWYKSSYADNALGFVPSVSNANVRFVINEGKVSCSNSIYKIHLCSETSCSPEAIAIAFQTSITQLSAEILSRTLGSGGLKLEPSDVLKLVMPSAMLGLSLKKAKEIFVKMDAMARAGNYEDARKLADQILILDAKIMSTNNYKILVTELGKLRNKRRHVECR